MVDVLNYVVDQKLDEKYFGHDYTDIAIFHVECYV
jgi:hypothetical protein